MRKPTIQILVIFTMILINNCSDDNNGPTSPDGETGKGTVAFLLTDAPGDFNKVTITFTEVSVNSEEGWIVVNDETQTHDLLTLSNGMTAALGETALEPGIYNQVRLKISGAEVVIGENSYHLDVPSGATSGLKLHGEFVIEENTLTELIVDFDAARSVHEMGKKGEYTLNPSLRLVGKAITGSIQGSVTNFEANPLAYVIADQDTITSAIVDESSGEFVLSFLPEGAYTVAVTDTLDKQFEAANITVTAGETTDMGEVTLE